MNSNSRQIPNRVARIFAPPVLLAGLLCPVAVSQTSQQELGGEIMDAWATPAQDTNGNGYSIVFTAESGPRIRRIDTLANTSVFEDIIGNWSLQPYGKKSELLHGIFVTSIRDYGIAVGSRGTGLWMSQDSGVWRPFSSSPSSATVLGSHLWKAYWYTDGESHFGVVAGENDTLVYTTTSNGTTWTKVTMPSPPSGYRRDFFSLAFSDQSSGSNQIGIAGYRLDNDSINLSENELGDGFGFLTTTDGINWSDAAAVSAPPSTQTSGPEPTYFVWDIDFVPGSATDAVAVGGMALGNSDGFAGSTSDAGVHWAWSLPVCNTANSSLGLCTTPSLSQSPASPCLGDYHNVGPRQSDKFSTLYGVGAQADGTAIAVSYAAGIWRFDPTSGSAGVWYEQSDNSLFATAPLWGCDALHAPASGGGSPADEVWAAGFIADIRRSTDQGQSFSQWTVECGHTSGSPNADRSWRLRDIAIATEGTLDWAWVVGRENRIAFSVDNGDTWEPVQWYYSGANATVPATPQRLDFIACSDADHAVAASKTNVFFTTQGSSAATTSPVCWAEASSGPSVSTITDVIWQNGSGDLERFWITASDGTVWLSEDTGDTWNLVDFSTPLPSGFDARSIAFGGSGVAILVGANTSSNDEGEALLLSSVPTSGNPIGVITYTDVCSATVPRLNAVVIGGSKAYAVGLAGTVMAYNSTNGFTSETIDWPSVDFLQVCAARPGSSGGFSFFASGFQGTLLLRLPGSQEAWHQIPSRTADQLCGMSFRSNPMLGMATGTSMSTYTLSPPSTPFDFSGSTIITIQ